MNVRNLGTIARMIIVIGGILGFVLVTIARADDVYNFYFQKGGAPQTVIQSGSGQSTAAKPTPAPAATADPSAPAPQTPAPVSKDTAAGSVSSLPPTTESSGQRPFTVSLGYGRSSDAVSSNPNYTLGFKYNFNRFLGARLQGRFRDTQYGTNNAYVANSGNAANKIGGMAALEFTPLRLDLIGHRFVELSVYAGGESYRRIGSDSTVTSAVSPMIGASAMLCLNDNVGIELQANKSAAKSTYVGANLAFQF